MRARTSAKGLAGASLAFRVLAALVGVVSLTMLLAQGWSVQSNYRDRSRLLNEHAAQIALIAAEGIARPLFDFNTPVVATSVAALARDPGFVGAAVFDTEGKQVAIVGALPQQGDNIVLQQEL